MTETKEITKKDMDEHGCFACPKCGEKICPEDENYEFLDAEGSCGAHELLFITVRHKCGQVILIDLTQ